MYHVGDRVAHPMHGAGTICAIQEQRCGGERRSYYVLCLLCGGLRLMIPCDAWEKAAGIGSGCIDLSQIFPSGSSPIASFPDFIRQS